MAFFRRARTLLRPAAVRQSLRQGLTLIEMVLVMALMVMIASITAPAFRRPLENYRLRKAGDVIRIAFTRARIRAMRSGTISGRTMRSMILNMAAFSLTSRL